MPLYFFNVHDGISIKDEEGVLLPDLDAAKRIALRYASALLADEGEKMWSGEDWHLEVTDETGLILLRVDFAASVSAAVT